MSIFIFTFSSKQTHPKKHIRKKCNRTHKHYNNSHHTNIIIFDVREFMGYHSFELFIFPAPLCVRDSKKHPEKRADAQLKNLPFGKKMGVETAQETTAYGIEKLNTLPFPSSETT